ncbi:MAG: hypothetical protein FWG87_04420 [Defluviitaleaceae bacterium]|nr:hypothetical protein [Defluviitaleaceae bacterium]
MQEFAQRYRAEGTWNNRHRVRIWRILKAMERGLRGFCPRKLLNDNIFSHERIRQIRGNPLNPCSATFNFHG